MSKRLTTKELIRTHPGYADRREKLILALCNGQITRNFQYTREDLVGKYIVAVADAILEELGNV